MKHKKYEDLANSAGIQCVVYMAMIIITENK
jgi:hypothetical protein